MSARKVLFGAMRFAIGFALLAFVLSRGGALESVGVLFRHAWLLPTAALLMALGAAVEAYRLALLFQSQALRLPWLDGFRVVSIGALFNFCIPGGTGGDVMKLYYLASGNPGRKVEVVTLLFVDRVVSLVSILAVALGCAALSADLLSAHPPILSLALVMLAGFVAICAFATLAVSEKLRASRLYTGTLNKLPFGGYVRRGMDAMYALRRHGGTLALAIGVSLIGHGLLLVLIVLTGHIVLPEVPIAPLCLLTVLGMIANVLPVTPAGLGVGEAVIDWLFRTAGYGAGSAIIVAWRIAQLPLLVLGAIFYATGTRKGADLLQAVEGARTDGG